MDIPNKIRRFIGTVITVIGMALVLGPLAIQSVDSNFSVSANIVAIGFSMVVIGYCFRDWNSE